jgi:hypothetical protein
MGNRPCSALCYDIDHSKSVNDSIVNKSSALWAKQLSADYCEEDEDGHHNHYAPGKRLRESHHQQPPMISPQKQNRTSPTASPNLQQTIVPDYPPYYYTGFGAACRSVSSDTAGREARTEHDLSRRSSNTTCDREEIQDEVCANRS